MNSKSFLLFLRAHEGTWVAVYIKIVGQSYVFIFVFPNYLLGVFRVMLGILGGEDAFQNGLSVINPSFNNLFYIILHHLLLRLHRFFLWNCSEEHHPVM